MADSVDLLSRIGIGLQWAVTFDIAFCMSCALIFAIDRCQHGAKNVANSEYNAYDAPTRNKIFKTVAWNLLFSIPVFGVLHSMAMPWWRTVWRPDLPLFISMPLFAVLADLCFYVLHRAAHWPPIYCRVHKKHHEITVAFAPGAIYCTTLEMWFVNMLTGIAPTFFLGLSDTEIWFLTAVGAVDTTMAHSRFSNFHFQHHRFIETAYGSSLSLVDHLLQTFVVDKQRRDRFLALWLDDPHQRLEKR